MPIAARTLPYRGGYDYGVGVNVGTGQRSGKAVSSEPNEISGVYRAVGGVGQLKLMKLTSTEDLTKSLGVSAEVTGGCGCFSANARMDYAESCSVHKDSLTLMIAHTIELGFQQLDLPKLRAGVGDIPQKAFQDRYGDLFVVGLSTGGLFYAVLQIEYSSMESKKTLEASLSGSYGLAFSGEVSMKLQTALNTTNSKVQVYLYHEGGSLVGHEHPQTCEEVLKAHSQWFNSIVGPDGKGTDLARPYSALAIPYVNAEGPLPPNEAEVQGQLDILAHCAMLRNGILDNLNLVNYIMAHAVNYEVRPESAQYLQEASAGLGKDLQQVKDTASHAINYIRDAQWPEVYKAPDGYKFFVLDASMIPSIRGANKIETPDLTHCVSFKDARDKAAEKGLTLQVMVDKKTPGDFKVLQQYPARGTPIAEGQPITITRPWLPMDIVLREERTRGVVMRDAINLRSRSFGGPV